MNKPQPPHPQYHVCWEQGETCGACGQRKKQRFTFAFFKPEPALALANDILKKGHTLIYVEQ